ncbi:hypothetical protein OG618_32925 [Kitasatospora sp. NBC_01246]|uniref:hypothetical protein n=1 Tax=Kitasatospora sp. NBC_01246 TaxID=2903570 RepID=UPI002E324728|nr:hypothetical protein [Kitasatospora sp. NBC_01246]
MRTRTFATALALAGAVVLAPAALPAAAHGDTVHLEVTGQDSGHVTTVATWENDHDPVTEEFAGSLAATSADGRSAGPWRLVAVPGHPGSYTTREMLPAGHWRITVDCAFPSLGHGERELDIEPAVISDPPLPTPTGTSGAQPTTAGPTVGPTVVPTPTLTSGATPAPTPPAGSPSAGPTAGPTAGQTVPPTQDTAAGSDGSSTAVRLAVGTAVAAVVLAATGFALRRGRRR